jgi:hypothetical protein
MAAVGQRRKRPLQPPKGTRLWLTPPEEDLFCELCGDVFKDEVRAPLRRVGARAALR